ncbi:MAG: HAMP domain-containing histidine kinase [Candidatus Eremiobacteraeota bacterium]|nr:HAMP domain-containing histidine kinase [Candidatus Eremiobacteraeota bacterium]
MIARLVTRYILLFLVVLIALDVVAYIFVSRIYAGELQPALGTPEYARAYGLAMRNVAVSIVLFNVPLVALVGILSYVLAKMTIRPLEMARQRERQFAAEAAHELRSPLATIAAVAQAAREQTGGELHASLGTIENTALDASEIVADLLTLAREPSQHALHREVLDLAILTQQCAREFEKRAVNSAVALVIQTESALVQGDERRLRELLRNLLENALRHARSVVRLRSLASGRFAEITVEDDGTGIDAGMRERIFERFYRANGSEGLGLGLAISRWIAYAHGGALTVSDADHGGALFRLRLPAVNMR